MSVARDSLIIFFSQIFAAFFIFLSGVVIAVTLGPKDKGAFDLFFSIGKFISALGGMGIGTASIYLINRKGRDSSKLFFNLLISGFFLCVILDVLLFLLFLFLPFLFSGLSYEYLFLLFFTIPFSIFHSLFLPFFLAKSRIAIWAFLSIFYSVLIFIGVVLSVVFLNLGVAGAIYSAAVSGFLMLLLIFLFLRSIAVTQLKFDFQLFLEEVRVGFAVYTGDIFKIVNQKLNLFIINFFGGIAGVGYYSVSLNLSSVLFLIPYSIQQVFYSVWSLSEHDEIDRVTPRVARQALIIGFAAALFLFLIGRFFILAVYGEEFGPSVIPFFLILPGAVFMIFSSIFFNNFFAKGKARVTTIILIITLAINILLNFILTPKYGIAGSAVSTSLSYLFSAVAALFYFSRMSNFPVSKILRFKASDFKQIYSNFRRILKSKHASRI